MTHIRTIGIVGGGQLGRMLTLAAKPLGFEVIALDPNADCPAAQVGAKIIIGDLYDETALRKLAKSADVTTIEIEHLNTHVLEQLQSEGAVIHPAPATVRMIQDKHRQKQVLHTHGIEVAPFAETVTKDDAKKVLKAFGGSMILKAKHGAYDGRGNAVVQSVHDLDAAWQTLGGRQLYAEQMVRFQKELSVIVARSSTGETKPYDVVEMKHERNICLEVTAPAQISHKAKKSALDLANRTLEALEGAGVFAIEMFLLADDTALVNEIAPRVHNSGHHTIESCQTSQFEQHVRAITGLPLGETTLVSPAVMVNILGTTEGDMTPHLESALQLPHTHFHWYGKSPIKIDRKMGHITALDDTVEAARKKAKQARKGLQV